MYKTIRFILLFIFLTFMFTLPTLRASASLAKCRTDPIFKLSNGAVINITLDVSTDATNIRDVIYALHVPTGVTVTKVTYTAGGIGTETYEVYQDSAAKAYMTDTIVTTQETDSIPVVATTRLNGVSSQSVSGYNGDHLVITVTKP